MPICKCGCGVEFQPKKPWGIFATEACRNRWHSRDNWARGKTKRQQGRVIKKRVKRTIKLIASGIPIQPNPDAPIKYVTKDQLASLMGSYRADQEVGFKKLEDSGCLTLWHWESGCWWVYDPVHITNLGDPNVSQTSE